MVPLLSILPYSINPTSEFLLCYVEVATKCFIWFIGWRCIEHSFDFNFDLSIWFRVLLLLFTFLIFIHPRSDLMLLGKSVYLHLHLDFGYIFIWFYVHLHLILSSSSLSSFWGLSSSNFIKWRFWTRKKVTSCFFFYSYLWYIRCLENIKHDNVFGSWYDYYYFNYGDPLVLDSSEQDNPPPPPPPFLW